MNSNTSLLEGRAASVARTLREQLWPHGPSIERIDKSGKMRRLDFVEGFLPSVEHFPKRLAQDAFYTIAYPLMLLSRRLEEKMMELFQKGYAKGTVTVSYGNEATAVGMGIPFRPGCDVLSLLHRDLIGHLLFGSSPYQLFCQYLANAESPTHGREGNVHHGDAAHRRFPMISHLGKMLSLVVGGTWAARRGGEDVFGLTVIGDGGTSTGEFHESLNLAAVRRVPVLFIVENNNYAFSTPTADQFRSRRLSDRAIGFGIQGKTIDGLDAWEVYSSVCDALEQMRDASMPYLLECRTLRLAGHAAYDKAEYVPAELMQEWRSRDPVPAARLRFMKYGGFSEEVTAEIEGRIDEEIYEAMQKALACERPNAADDSWASYAPPTVKKALPYRAAKVKNGDAVNRALDYLLTNHPDAFLMGLDIGRYGSAFKTCKGLIDKHGPERVIDMPMAESSYVGFAIGASQVNLKPIVEFQFADFSTEAVSQLGLNAATWFYRSGSPAPLLMRLPCGGGLTMGAFHSGEMEGLWSRFPGLKLLYPATAQETFEALVAGYYDPNPCLVFEHKLLYWSKSGDIDFDGDLESVWRPRCYREGNDVTVVAFGAMVHEALNAAAKSTRGIEVWNPFVLHPLNLDLIVESVRKTGRLVVVQECGAAFGLGDQIVGRLTREAFGALKAPPQLVAAINVPIPFAPELESHYRPNVEKILNAVERMF